MAGRQLAHQRHGVTNDQVAVLLVAGDNCHLVAAAFRLNSGPASELESLWQSCVCLVFHKIIRLSLRVH